MKPFFLDPFPSITPLKTEFISDVVRFTCRHNARLLCARSHSGCLSPGQPSRPDIDANHDAGESRCPTLFPPCPVHPSTPSLWAPQVPACPSKRLNGSGDQLQTCNIVCAHGRRLLRGCLNNIITNSYGRRPL